MKASCTSHSNLALIKYWGNRNDALRLPVTGSISFNLDQAFTTTTVEFGGLTADQVELDGTPASGAAAERISRHLDLLRALAGSSQPARVVSRNNFPMGAGIASSASGFAALTCAAAWALGLDLPERELSRLARRGSGSASRSVPAGFVEWHASGDDAQSFAETLAPAEHWPLHDLVAIVAHGEKTVGSTEGHHLAHSSPLYRARVARVEHDLPVMRRAILMRDFQALGELAEADALSMHAVMLTSRPSLLYWSPGHRRAHPRHPRVAACRARLLLHHRRRAERARPVYAGVRGRNGAKTARAARGRRSDRMPGRTRRAAQQ